ncbi:MAG: tetratricopeptide repeat protein [Chloroflexota bacterium]
MWRKVSVMCAIIAAVLVGCGPTARHITGGNEQFAQGNYAEALRRYEAAQVANPDRPEPYFNAAASLSQMNDLEEARAALEQALRTADPDLGTLAYFNLGNVYAGMGEFARAADAYREGLRIDPENEDLRYNLEVVLLLYVEPTPTALEQQTEPEQEQTDPEATPTPDPGGFTGPTPSPPPQDFDLSATPDSGEGMGGDRESSTPVPQSQGQMDVEQAERLLDQIQQDQQALREFLEQPAEQGNIVEKDW